MSEVNGPPGSPGPQSVRTGPQPVGPARQRVGPAPQRIGGWTRFVTARPRLALLAALVITALAVFAGSRVADRMGSGGWQAPDAESSYATEALEREFPASQPNLLLLTEGEPRRPGGAHGRRGDTRGRPGRGEGHHGGVGQWLLPGHGPRAPCSSAPGPRPV
ncbi:hypothetical protein SMICM17S_07138 [Streptomyces microflavus]